MQEDDYAFDSLRIDFRDRVEHKPLVREVTLITALRKLPALWTKSICRALGIEASNRDRERKSAIQQYLLSQDSILRVWESLPEPSRRIAAWLILDRGGACEVGELYEKFGVDNDISYFWDKGELPTTALGLLRLHGLVYKGFTPSEAGLVKIAVVPVDLRVLIETAARSPRAFKSAPPMPEPEYVKTIAFEEKLEVISQYQTCPVTGEYRNVYQFLVTLQEIKPAVWRRILVPETYSFWDLHVAIQDAMGWLDCHLHEFNIQDPVAGKEILIGIPDYEFIDEHFVIDDTSQWIMNYFTMDNPHAGYLYDFGDSWHHEIKLEAVIPRETGAIYPACTGGERACPPEDCGGTDGYADFLRIVSDPLDEEYWDMIRWFGGPFDAGWFEPSYVHFDNPNLRWRAAFLDDEEIYESLMIQREEAPAPPPVTYRNRMGETYFLRFETTKSGGSSFFFSKKAGENPVRVMPAGFEISEHPDGRVCLQIKQDLDITERERLIVESAVKAAGITDWEVEARGRMITILVGDVDEVSFLDILDLPNSPALKGLVHDMLEKLGSSLPDPRTPSELLREIQSYSPVMRFTLVDDEKRTFTAERVCYYSDFEEWAPIGGPDRIDKIANKFCSHLGRDSFFDL